MNKSYPYHLCQIFKLTRENSPQYEGKYIITARDLAFAKDFLLASGEPPDDDEIISQTKQYLTETGYNDWLKSEKHPAWELWRNWNKYTPPVRVKTRLKVKCYECEDRGIVTYHFEDEKCHECKKRNAVV